MRKSGGRSRAKLLRSMVGFVGLEALEARALLDGSPFVTGEFTPTGGTPTLVAGPGGLDGAPLLDLNNDGVGDMIIRYPVGGSSTEVAAVISDGADPTTLVRNWRLYRIAGYANPNTIVSVTTGDINDDGLADVLVQWTATSSASSNRAIDFFVAQPGGVFVTGQTITLGSLTRGAELSIFDATGDGVNDVFQRTDAKITVYKSNGDGTVANGVASNLGISSVTNFSVAQDLTGDNIPDIVISGWNGQLNGDNSFQQALGVYKGSASGGYSPDAPAYLNTADNLAFMRFAELDGDPGLDILAYSAPLLTLGQPAAMFALRNNGTGSFTQSWTSGSFTQGLYNQLDADGDPLIPLSIGDFDNDNDLDIAVIEGNYFSNDITIHIETNNGNGGFTQTQQFDASGFQSNSQLLASDLDADGYVDLTLNHSKANLSGTQTTVFFSQGDGTFESALVLDTGLSSATNARLADFNNDGQIDVQFMGYESNLSGYALVVLLNAGHSFAEPVVTNLGGVSVPQGGAAENFAVLPIRDYDGDGYVDILGNGTSPVGMTVLHGNGDGTFDFLTPSLIFGVNANAATGANLGDFNNDGKPDLVFTTNSTGSVGVTAVINGTPLPADTAGTDHNDPYFIADPITNRFTAIEHVGPAANADQRDRFDFYRFSIDTDKTVRVAVIPDVAAVYLNTAREDGIGTGNAFPTGLMPVFIDKALTAGTWHTDVISFSGSETDYRLDIIAPVAGADIGVYQGLDKRVSDQDPIDFGSLPRHTTDTRRTFLVRNDGLTTLNLSAVRFPAGFSFADNTLAASIAPGAFDYFNIELNTDTPGAYGGDIVIPSDDADTPEFVIPVTAIVTDTGPNPLPLLSVLLSTATLTDGQSVNFGATNQGNGNPLRKTFTLRNDGIANLTITSLQVPAGYAITEPLSPTTLSPGQSDNFTVTVGTATAGNYFGDITFNHNSGGVASTFTIPVAATITGDGVVPLPNLTGEIQDVLLKGASITDSTALLPGDKVTAKLRVFNAAPGAVPAGNTKITFYVSSDFAIDGNDTELQSFTIKNPKPVSGSFTDLKFDVTLPPTLASGNFRLLAKLDADNSIEETNNNDNTAPSGKVMNIVLQAGQVVGRKNSKLTLRQSDGTLVTFALSSAGVADVLFNSQTGAFDVIISGGTAKSVLTITTKGGGNATLLGNVTATVSSFAPLTTPILGKIIAKTATLTGDLNVNGGLQALTLKGISDGSVFIGSASSVPKQTVTLALGSVHNANVTSHTPIKSLTAIEWIDDDDDQDKLIAASIGTLGVSGAKKPAPRAGDFEADIRGSDGNNAPLVSAKIAGSVSGAEWKLAGTVTSITVKGDLGAADGPVSIEAPAVKNIAIGGSARLVAIDLTQAYDPAKPKRQSLPKLVIKGTVDGLEINSADGVGTIQTGAMSNSRIFVGVDDDATALPGEADAFTSDPGPGITSLIVANGFASSSIAARAIGAVSLPTITTANGSVPFGIATTAIKTLKIAGVKQPDADKDGNVDAINTPDFVLRLL